MPWGGRRATSWPRKLLLSITSELSEMWIDFKNTTMSRRAYCYVFLIVVGFPDGKEPQTLGSSPRYVVAERLYAVG